MGVTLTKIVEKMELRNLTPDVDMTQREVKIPDINRPALQLAGFFDHFVLRTDSAYRICRVHLSADTGI